MAAVEAPQTPGFDRPRADRFLPIESNNGGNDEATYLLTPLGGASRLRPVAEAREEAIMESSLFNDNRRQVYESYVAEDYVARDGSAMDQRWVSDGSVRIN